MPICKLLWADRLEEDACTKGRSSLFWLRISLSPLSQRLLVFSSYEPIEQEFTWTRQAGFTGFQGFELPLLPPPPPLPPQTKKNKQTNKQTKGPSSVATFWRLSSLLLLGLQEAKRLRRSSEKILEPTLILGPWTGIGRGRWEVSLLSRSLCGQRVRVFVNKTLTTVSNPFFKINPKLVFPYFVEIVQTTSTELTLLLFRMINGTSSIY